MRKHIMFFSTQSIFPPIYRLTAKLDGQPLKEEKEKGDGEIILKMTGANKS